MRSRARNDLKARATDEPHGDLADVERYEQLRRDALAGGPSGFRQGLALLQRRGVAAWARAWATTLPSSAAAPAAATARDRAEASEEIVGMLATMALACLAGR